MSASVAGEGARGPRTFSPAMAAGVVVVGVLAFCLLFVGSALDNGGREDLDGGAHALSKSAVGYAGAVDLLRSMGRPVVVARGPVPPQSALNALMILTIDDGDPSTPLLGMSTTIKFSGPVLAIIPKWDVRAHPSKLGWVNKTGLRKVPVDQWVGPSDPPDKIVLNRASGKAVHRLTQMRDGVAGASVLTGAIEAFQTLEAPKDWNALIVDEQGRTVLMQHRDTGFYVLSEPDLLNTQGLRDLANARAGLAVLDALPNAGGPVIFDVTLNGFERTRSVLKLAFEPPFIAATFCVLAAALMMVWHAFFRFGRERAETRAFALGKRALADNQAALIKMARREHRLGGRYGVIVRDLAARAVGAPREMTPDELDAFLDRLGSGGRTSWPLSTLRADLEQAKDSTELVRAAGRLHQWKLEMTRERQ